MILYFTLFLMPTSEAYNTFIILFINSWTTNKIKNILVHTTINKNKMGYPQFNPIRDLISGAIMAATSVPQLIAYAETVGYAGYRGTSRV